MEIEASFLGGMLHDVGKIVLDRFFGKFYVPVLEQAKEEQISLYDAEKDTLGVSHSDIGGQLAKEWNFSANYVNSIMHHHTPRQTRRHRRLLAVVHLADAIYRELEFGNSGDDTPPKIDESVLDQFNLGDRGMQILKEAAEEDLENANSFLSGLAG